MAANDAIRGIAALTGQAFELDASDVEAAAKAYDRDGDPATINADELDRYLDRHDVGFLQRRLARQLLFAGRDRVTPQEAMDTLTRRFGDGTSVCGVTLRKRR